MKYYLKFAGSDVLNRKIETELEISTFSCSGALIIFFDIYELKPGMIP